MPASIKNNGSAVSSFSSLQRASGAGGDGFTAPQTDAYTRARAIELTYRDSFERTPPRSFNTVFGGPRLSTPASEMAEIAARIGAMAQEQAQGVNGVSMNGLPEVATGNKLMDAYGRLYAPSAPIEQLPAFQPNNGMPVAADNPRIQVNGIMTNAVDQRMAAQDLANATGQPVLAFRNASEGFLGDLKESIAGKLGVNTQVAQSLADVIGQRVMAGKPITLDVHSQGGIVVSEALNHLVDTMRNGAGMTPDQIRQALGNITINSYGAASQRYMDGVQYKHNINQFDPVPTNFGLGGSFTPIGNYWNTAPGANAEVNRYFGFHLDPHGFDKYVNDVFGPHTPPQLQELPAAQAPQAGGAPAGTPGSFGFEPFGTPTLAPDIGFPGGKSPAAFNPIDAGFAPTPAPGSSFGFGPYGMPDNLASAVPTLSSPTAPVGGIGSIGSSSFGLNGPVGAPSFGIGAPTFGFNGPMDPSLGFARTPSPLDGPTDPSYGFASPSLGLASPPSIGIGSTPGGLSPGIGSAGSSVPSIGGSSIGIGGIGSSGLTGFGLNGPVDTSSSSGVAGGSPSSIGVGTIGSSGLSPGGFDSFGASPIGGGSFSAPSAPSTSSSSD